MRFQSYAITQPPISMASMTRRVLSVGCSVGFNSQQAVLTGPAVKVPNRGAAWAAGTRAKSHSPRPRRHAPPPPARPPAAVAAPSYATFLGLASPPTSYGGYGGNAKETAK